MNEHESFLGMVEYWTIRDYWTQAVKSEVIIDMLISDFVGEMLAAQLAMEQGKENPKNVALLAKEFPIKKPGEKRKTKDGREYLSNDKVDYMIAADKELYLVELKTTVNSYSEEQLRNMEAVRGGGISALWEFFFKVMASKVEKGKGAIDSKKYMNTLFHIEKEARILSGDSIKSFKDYSDSIDRRMLSKVQTILSKQYDKIGIAYIGPEKLKATLSPKNVTFVNLEEFIAPQGAVREKFNALLSKDKKRKWCLVADILSQCIGASDPPAVIWESNAQ